MNCAACPNDSQGLIFQRVSLAESRPRIRVRALGCRSNRLPRPGVACAQCLPVSAAGSCPSFRSPTPLHSGLLAADLQWMAVICASSRVPARAGIYHSYDIVSAIAEPSSFERLGPPL